MKTSRNTQRGFTLTEMVVALLLVSVLAAAVMALFRTSWLSYQNLVWQSKVNMEARRGLDDACDSLRMGGANTDLTAPHYVNPQVNSISTPFRVEFNPPWGNELTYQIRTRYGQKYLTRMVGQNQSNARLVGQYIKQVQFEYEYRLPAASENDTAWQSVRVSQPGSDAQYLTHTVYVTVTAEAKPFGDGGPVYTRRMTGAVHLRGPYNTRTPRAKYVP